MQSNQKSNDVLALFDNAPLNRRYWAIFALMSAVFVFDFFDFPVVGYLLAAVAQEWHLTHGQSNGFSRRNRSAGWPPREGSPRPAPRWRGTSVWPSMALVGLSSLFLGIETHGKAMVLDHGAAH
jgi:hypothetical protein